MLSTVKKSTGAKPQTSGKDWPLKIAEPNLKYLNPLCDSPSNDFADLKKTSGTEK